MDIVLNDFISTRFSYPVIQQLQWKTDVVIFDSGKEQRNQIWETPIRLWELTWDIMSETARNQMVELYQRAKGRANTFQFRDELDRIGSSTKTQVQQIVLIVSAADAVIKTFRITADVATLFPDGTTFEITAGANDGVFTVNGDATSDGTTTSIIVNEVVAAEGSARTLLPQDFQLNHTYYVGETEAWTEDKVEIEHFTITDVDIANDTFTIVGIHASKFPAAQKFIVQGSTGNDANWIVESTERSGSNTVITVTGNIGNAIVDGTIILLYVTSNAVAQVPTTEYTVDVHTGLITFTENQSPTNGHVVIGVYNFNYRVRFSEDMHEDNAFSYEKWQIDGLLINEVKS